MAIRVETLLMTRLWQKQYPIKNETRFCVLIDQFDKILDIEKSPHKNFFLSRVLLENLSHILDLLAPCIPLRNLF